MKLNRVQGCQIQNLKISSSLRKIRNLSGEFFFKISRKIRKFSFGDLRSKWASFEWNQSFYSNSTSRKHGYAYHLFSKNKSKYFFDKDTLI